MDPVTHVAASVLLSQALPAPSRGWAALAGVILGFLPDLDYFLMSHDRLAFITHHRGFSHSLLVVPLFALAVAGLGAALGGRGWFRPLLVLSLAALGLHLFLDLITSYGTQLLNPLSHRRFTLDWVFIIDPWLTAILAAGVIGALSYPPWRQKTATLGLAVALGYIFLCGFYHREALGLARRVFKERGLPVSEAAALPQPFSGRRWLLIASGPAEILESFILLPRLPSWGNPKRVKVSAVNPPQDNCRPPMAPYQPVGGGLTAWRWSREAEPPGEMGPEARRLIKTYLEFARFPLLLSRQNHGQETTLEWVDLRFTVPGRRFPFRLTLTLDGMGELKEWDMGPCGVIPR